MFSFQQKQYLLSLARRALTHYLTTGQVLKIESNEVPAELKEIRACFVTLTIQGNLRGCIGHILPIQRLYQDVIENAISAAFQDSRFPPLTQSELPKTKIEISILSLPKPLIFNSPSDLLSKLAPNQDGVILKLGFNQATFLPQVWEELPQKEEFLSHLCLKAGLGPICWKEPDIKIDIYQVEAFEEERA
ncbi:MAG: AmmeMemoRadiSam system protein A [Candidatus Magasanikbacteria bacterium]|nr:AmmeMemoRadiSam system protein A [Candidatus Magasanikbacteria bacterium]